MKKFLLCLFATIIIAGSAVVCSAAPEPKASSAIMASLTSDQIIYSKNPDSRLAPAEFTKLMSAYTTYKLYGIDTVITVPENIGQYTTYLDSTMKLKSGEQINSGHLISGMIVEQANDAVYAVALAYGGVDAFVAKMNEYAKELEMENTVYTNPTGKEDANQYTNATDLLKLYKAVYKDRTLYSFLTAKSVVIPATNLSEERNYWTKNHLMSRFIYLDYIYSYANAGVSSSTDFGGYSVISSAVKGDRELVCIILNSVREDDVNHSMIDAQNLFNYGFNELKTVDVVKQGGLLYEAKLKNGKDKETLLLCAGKSLKAEILDDDDVSAIEKQIVLTEPVEAPVKKGDVVGNVVYTYQGNYVGEVELLAEQDVKKSMIKAIFDGIGWFFGLKAIKTILIIALIIVLVLFATAYVKARQRRRRRRNRRRNYKKF